MYNYHGRVQSDHNPVERDDPGERRGHAEATTWSGHGRMGSGAPMEGWPWIRANSSISVRGMKTEQMGTNASRSSLLVAK